MRYAAACLAALIVSACSEQAATVAEDAQVAEIADVAAGEAAFRQQCLLCHSAAAGDGGGAQGPALGGVVGRPAASHPQFSYTAALRQAALTWDEPTLDRFLAAPTEVVPGSSMVIPVAGEADRKNIIAYLATTAAAPTETASAAPAPAASGGDWRGDAPGVRHRIDVNALPAPYATEGARNFPQLAAKPADATLSTPEGFAVAEFATGLEQPRRMLQAANGDIFVAENRAGRITVLRPSADGASVAEKFVYAEGLNLPFGMLFYPSTESPSWLYVSEGNRVVRYPFAVGDTAASGEAEVVVPALPTEGHYTRDIAFSRDGETLFVSVGSQSNVAETMPRKSVEEAAAWEAEHGLGALWGNEERRAAVLAFAREGDPTGRTYATGIRNCVRLTVQPDSGDLWCTTNERDMLGDDLVPDYSTTVQEGGFYGWPWYYIGDNEDPRLAGQRPDLKGKVIVPDVPFTSHSAAVDLVFYEPSEGASAFPPEYVGDGFAVHHGSWNRGPRTGGKIVRVLMENGEPTGEYEDFLTGFVIDDGAVWGRPVGLAQLADGSLLLSDDGANVIYRISHAN